MKKGNLAKKSVFTLVISIVLISLYSMTVLAKTNAQRLAGKDRFTTAIEVSQSGWQQSDYVLLAYGRNFPDSLSAAPLAKKYNAPVLLTETDSLSPELKNELIRLKAKHVFILGGTGVVSQNVENQITSLGINVERLAGSNRYETSVKIAENVGNSSEIVVAFSHDFSDALSVSSIAAVKNMPILLVYKDSLDDSIKKFIESRNIKKTYVIGDSGVISDSVVSQLPNVERITGKDKYERNLAILNRFANEIDFNNTFVATGNDFPDSLSGSALAAINGAPILLINKNDTNKVKQLLANKKIDKLTVLGGTGVVDDNTVSDISNNVNNNPDSSNGGDSANVELQIVDID